LKKQKKAADVITTTGLGFTGWDGVKSSNQPRGIWAFFLVFWPVVGFSVAMLPN
jgi:hypothetical protein